MQIDQKIAKRVKSLYRGGSSDAQIGRIIPREFHRLYEFIPLDKDRGFRIRLESMRVLHERKSDWDRQSLQVETEYFGLMEDLKEIPWNQAKKEAFKYDKAE